MKDPDALAIANNWQQHNAQVLLQRIEQANICGMGGGAFPVAKKLSAALQWQAGQANRTVQFIANGVACEPGIDADPWLTEEAPQDVLLGALIVARVLAIEEVTLALGPRLQHLAATLQRCWESLVKPQPVALNIFNADDSPAAGAERLLIAAVTGSQPAHSLAPATQGYVVHNVTTLWAIACAVAKGKPITQRPVTIGTHTQWLPLGTPVTELTQAASCNRDGGRWSSLPLAANSVITIGTLALHRSDPIVASPCIGCGECAAICPVDIDPEALHRIGQQLPNRAPLVSDAQSDHGPVTRLQQAGITECIECGACNACCPSQIDLLADFRHSKQIARAVAAAQAQADRASERFERHQQRLAQRAAASASKRAARLQRSRSWDSGESVS